MNPRFTCTWSVASGPTGASPTFSVNGSNAAKNTTVAFNEAGSYTFTVSIKDGQGDTATSTVNVTVRQTLTSITVGPGSALGSAATQQFTAAAYDQFGNTMQTQPAFTWSNTGAGSINSSTGLYTASYTSGTATVTATSGSASGSAVVTVTDATPTVATAAKAGSSTVTGTSTSLSVLGADSDGGGESNLTYTWTETGGPSGATFAANGSNAAKNTSVTFTQAGNYTFLATITDKGGLSTTSTVNVTVSQTLTSITVGPGGSTPGLGGRAAVHGCGIRSIRQHDADAAGVHLVEHGGGLDQQFNRAVHGLLHFRHGHGHGHEWERQRLRRGDSDRRSPHGGHGGRRRVLDGHRHQHQPLRAWG